ncbi:methyltransferase-domain-containing protein [Epithele typhae]|uniref:methyltransferase-domain-containing protein n=1 Tax=Epithele typhae TaxID=378194 RepID=UPI002007F3B5|nr:methyltransferase-domain-containing protein [Epithele typhae]KAH9921696.1 methyltransferase-domain-containing protein [Epithele typhae]
MSLFEVPGWSVPDAPVAQAGSKKRKRPAPVKDNDGDGVDEAQRMRDAQKNIEKLMKSLGAGMEALDGDDAVRPNKKKREGKEKEKSNTAKGEKGKETDMASGSRKEVKWKTATPQKREERGRTQDKKPKKDGKSAVKASKKKNKKERKAYAQSADARSEAGSVKGDRGTDADASAGLTALQAKMKSNLGGARFRWINETLYKTSSLEAHELMSKDPAIFADYHTGFRHQVDSWPTNPVSYYIDALSSYPPKTVVADLGCGDAALARALVPKGYTILSFDLVSDDAYVIEADTCSRVPLPGSEESGEQREGQVVDVVVCALSLMGTNWVGCMREAWRVLRAGGELKVAEVASRFTSIDDFVAVVSACGFKLVSKDDKNTHFTLFEFKKVHRDAISDKQWSKFMERGSVLKPCEYKRR